MVILSGGLEIYVEVEGKKAVEYNVQHTSKDKTNTASCVIEAKEGQTFKVYYNQLPTEAKHQTKVKLSVDGTPLSSHIECLHKPDKSTKGSFKGFWETKSKTKQNLRAFVFGKTQTTSESSFQNLPRHLKEEGCTIKVDVKLCPRGRYKHAKRKGKAEEKKLTALSATCVHKDTKPAILGLLTEPGPVIASINSRGGRLCHCVVGKQIKFHQIVTFQYLSHEWLIRGNHKKDPRDDIQQRNDVKPAEQSRASGPSKVDLHETKAAGGVNNDHVIDQLEASSSAQPRLLKRRAGSEPLITRPDSRIKIEPSIGIEVGTVIKRECSAMNAAAPRRIEVDATGEGEDYLVHQKVIEIVDLTGDD